MVTEITDCHISGHYYKIDLGKAQLELNAVPRDVEITYYVKCQRCGYRILVNDKCAQGRKDGTYKL